MKLLFNPEFYEGEVLKQTVIGKSPPQTSSGGQLVCKAEMNSCKESSREPKFLKGKRVLSLRKVDL